MGNALTLFPQLSKLVSPRIMAAVIHTMWNGWCTHRRFQVDNSVCLFGCGAASNEDSIEHYVFCSVFRNFLECFLKTGHFLAIDEFLLLSHVGWDDRELKNRDFAVCALYKAHNRMRTSGLLRNSLFDLLSRTVMHLRNARHAA